jgi:hypothetical protein
VQQRSGGSAANAIQCQPKSGSGHGATAARSKADPAALIARFKARLFFLVNQYVTLQNAYTSVKAGQMPGVPSAAQHIHEALAFAFIEHNPGAIIKSMDKDVVGIDTRGVTAWKEVRSWEGVSHGEYLATHYPSYKKFFITGPGTLWITRAGVEAHPDDYRDFLWRSCDVPESELAELMDSAYVQAAHGAWNWIKSWDSEQPREAPAVIQFIADLNPLTGVAKALSIVMDDKPLYAMPGTKATKLDKVEASLGVLAASEAVLGDLVQGAVKGARAAKLVGVSRKIANPLGHLSEAVVTSWSKDEALREIFASLVEWHLDKAVWEGIIHPLGELGDDKTKEKGR